MSQVMSVLVVHRQEPQAPVNMTQTYARRLPSGQCSRCYVMHLLASDRFLALLCVWCMVLISGADYSQPLLRYALFAMIS